MTRDPEQLLQLIVEKNKAIITQKKANKPLILNLTNSVTINDVANIEITSSASPVMSDQIDDALSLLNYSQTLLLNIGTINNYQFDLMHQVASKAYTLQIPVILDLVGYKASQYRTDCCHRLIPYANVIKGNASEISSWLGFEQITKGVDATTSGLTIGLNALQTAMTKKARLYQCYIIMTGKYDYIADEKDCYMLGLKTPKPLWATFKPWPVETNYPPNLDLSFASQFTDITGTGCMLTGHLATYIAIELSLSSLMAGMFTFKYAPSQSMQ